MTGGSRSISLTFNDQDVTTPVYSRDAVQFGRAVRLPVLIIGRLGLGSKLFKQAT